MDDESREVPQIDQSELSAQEGFRIESKNFPPEADGTWWATRLLKHDEPVITLTLNRRNDLKTVVNTETDASEATAYVEGYFRDNKIPKKPGFTRDQMGRRIFQSTRPGTSFALTEGLGDEKIKQVEITILNRMTSEEVNDPEGYLQHRSRQLAAVVGAFQKETRGLLIRDLYKISNIAIMSPRLFK